METLFRWIFTHGNFISLDFYPWKVYFIGLACKKGQGVGIVIISSNSVKFERLSRLNYYCTKNQAEYEALLFGLEILQSMQVKHVFFSNHAGELRVISLRKKKGTPPDGLATPREVKHVEAFDDFLLVLQ